MHNARAPFAGCILGQGFDVRSSTASFPASGCKSCSTFSSSASNRVLAGGHFHRQESSSPLLQCRKRCASALVSFPCPLLAASLTSWTYSKSAALVVGANLGARKHCAFSSSYTAPRRALPPTQCQTGQTGGGYEALDRRALLSASAALGTSCALASPCPTLCVGSIALLRCASLSGF